MVTVTTSQSVAGASSSNGESVYYWAADERGLVKSKSVVQSLFTRELGNQYFYRDGDSSVVAVARQLLNSRAVSDDISEKPVKAVKVDLKQGKSTNEQKRNKQQKSWIQIGIPEKAEVGITDTRIWTRTKLGSGRNATTKMTREEFYSVESASIPSFKCLKKLHSSASGKIKKTFVVAGRVLTDEKLTTHFLTLMEPGILRAYDLVKNEVTDELRLPTEISQGVTGFTEMDVCDNSRKIFIMGTGKKLTKVIIVMNYAPWKEMSLIHVEVPFQLEMQEGVCFLLQGKHFLQITSWPLIMQKVIKNIADVSEKNTSSRSVLPTIEFEGRLTEMPEILTKVRLNSEYIGLVNTNSVPMFFGILKSGLNFFTFHKEPAPIYEFKIDFEDSADPVDVFLFPDGSSKALICTHFNNQSQFIEFSAVWNDGKGEKTVNVSMLEAFCYWKEQRPVTLSTVSGNGRRKRTCVNNNVNNSLIINKPAILGMQYCTVMNLIAVLTADEEQFQVAIYDPLKLKMVKALPPVYAWPRRNDDVNKRRESINNLDFIFETEFMFVSFQYSSDCKPQREVFMVHLLSEKQ